MIKLIVRFVALVLLSAPQTGIRASGEADPTPASRSTPSATTSQDVPSSSVLPPPVVNDAVWRPGPQLSWQLQFATTPVDLSVEADVYKIDLFDNDAEVVSELHDKGKKVVCYLNAGAWEDWRPDAKRFPAAAMGRAYKGWAGERWLDIRRIDLLAPVMLARLDLCKDKGFNGVMLDNVNSYTNKTGFPLTGWDQLRFNVWLANEARKRGLAVGMNNNSEQARQLLPYFDWVLAESCFSQGWCKALRPFAEQGKPVVVIEYTKDSARVAALCRKASALHFSLLLKKRELDAYRLDCSRRAGASGKRL
jgi:hypothetical protein